MTASSIAGPSRFPWRTLAKRFALATLAAFVVTVVLVLAGVPKPLAQAITAGVSLTIAFAGEFPGDTPRRTRKNALLWGAHFVPFAGAHLLVSYLQGT